LTNATSQTSAEGSSVVRGRVLSVPQNLVVSIVIPMRNEAEHIRSCLDSLVNQTFSHDKYEILVADGRSSDNSRQIASLYEGGDVSVRLLDNLSETTPSGMNRTHHNHRRCPYDISTQLCGELCPVFGQDWGRRRWRARGDGISQ
jgi:glycosyltransferase involved in cell wall biosynthesis